MRVWAKLVNRRYGDADRVLVLEDDAKLKPGFLPTVRKLLRQSGDLDYDLLLLNWYTHLTDPSCVHNVPGRSEVVLLRCDSGLNTGTNAYVITARGARRALAALTPLRETSKDIQLGRQSRSLNWFGATVHTTGHDWSARSVRVYGDG